MKKYLLIAACLFSAIAGYSQVVDSAIVPQYIQGQNGTNNSRTPFYFHVSLSGLTPNATYRYYAAMDTANASATSNGAGVLLLINNVTQTFRRASTGSFSNPASHDSLTADATGRWSGWMGVEPSGNARFTPGRTMFPKIIMNNGNGGTAVANRVSLSAYPVTVINYGTAPSSPLQGSFVYDSTTVAPKNFALLYGNTAGTGRPVSIAVVEEDGVSLSAVSSILPLYRANADTFAQRWGTIVPNDLSTGIQLLQYRSFATTSVISSISDANGVWCFANTVNPSHGDTIAMYIRSLETIPNPQILNLTTNYCATDSVTLLASGTGTISWYTTSVGGPMIATGSPATVLANSVFYAQSDSGACKSGRDSVFFNIQNPVMYFADSDGDTYGDPGNMVITCVPATGYVGNNQDCDDTDPNVNLDATEVCNGIDDDCDLQIDEGCVSAPELEVVYPDFQLTGVATNIDVANATLEMFIDLCSVSGQLDFYIKNTGNDTMLVSTPVNLTQSGQYVNFGVSAQPQNVILPGDSSLLPIAFTNITVNGADSAFVTITTNDADESPYVIKILSSIMCSGLEDQGAVAGVTIYPTPADEVSYLQLDMETAADVTVSILDLSGKKVYGITQICADGMNVITLPVAQLSSGMYLVEISADDTRITKKLIRK